MGAATNWKTTLFGILAAAGLAASTGQIFPESSHAKSWGGLAAIVGTVGLGYNSKDKDVTGGKREQ